METPVGTDISSISRITAIGIDVSDKRKDIAKLLYTACGRAIKKYGYEFDDVYQEVCIGIIIRNRGRGAYDPVRSSFGHYVTMVCNSVFRNFHAKEQKKKNREVIGVRNLSGEMVDVGDTAESVTDEYPELSEITDIDKYLDLVAERSSDPRISWEIKTNKDVYRKILGGIIAGFSKDEISKMIGVSRPQIYKILKRYLDEEPTEPVVDKNSILFMVG